MMSNTVDKYGRVYVMLNHHLIQGHKSKVYYTMQMMLIKMFRRLKRNDYKIYLYSLITRVIDMTNFKIKSTNQVIVERNPKNDE
jgi:hypothetical protein